MGDLEFYLYKIPSIVGDWLAIFERSKLVFLVSYNPGKKQVHAEAAEFLHKHYHFHIGKFETVNWTKGNFWGKKHKISIQGTEFQVKVWMELLKIQNGELVTYSDIAKRLKKPSAVRAVASAIAQNPVCYWVACHRVIGQGRNLYKYRGGKDTKIAMLESEGVFI